MNKIRRFFSTHFNWDEMCEDEETRIRSNSTIFFTAIAFAFFIMAVLNIITMTINLLIVTGVLCVVFSFYHFWLLNIHIYIKI